MKKAKSCGMIPFTKEGDQYKFLVILQKPGHWVFPKGTQVKGETDIETALREFTEECGIKEVQILSNDTFIDQYFMSKDGIDIDKEVVYFLGEVAGTNVNIQPEEIDSFAWLTYSETTEKLTYPGTVEAFRKAFKKLIELQGEVA